MYTEYERSMRDNVEWVRDEIKQKGLKVLFLLLLHGMMRDAWVYLKPFKKSKHNANKSGKQNKM